jgi:hypothetical protein
MTMRCQIEAMRALCYLTAATFDRASHLPDETQRREARALADLLTPVAKSWCTDVGNEVTSLAIQIFGGAGFVEESGVAQHYRDIRIMSIFEGSNGIQAQDLVGRKLPQSAGETVNRLLIEMTTLASELRDGDDRLSEIGRSLDSGIAALQRATDWMLAHGGGLPLPAAAGATAYQRLFGGVLAGHLLARGALAAHRLRQRIDQGGYSADFLEAKIASARFYCTHLLGSACALEQSATAGAEAIFGIAPEAL